MRNLIYIPDPAERLTEQLAEPFSHEDLLRMEGMIAEISARIAETPPDQLDQEIQFSLGTLCRLMGIVRGALLEITEDYAVVQVAYAWFARDVAPVSSAINLAELYPWSYRKVVIEGNILAINSMALLPETAAIDRQSYAQLQTKSSLTIPLYSSDRVKYIIVAHALDEEIYWQEEFILRFGLVGNIFVSALRQRQISWQLETSKKHVDMVVNSAEIGLWEFNHVSGNVWLNHKALALFGSTPSDAQHFESLLNRIHADDRKLLREEIDKSVHAKSQMCIEIRVTDATGGIRWLLLQGHYQRGTHSTLPRFVGVAQDCTTQKLLQQKLELQNIENERLRKQLELENAYLRKEVNKQPQDETPALGVSVSMREIMLKIKQVAATASTVLIQGETGTGKELIAQTIHKLSDRRMRQMVTVNCAALPVALVESELFGRERGAFTGAVSKQIGRFELADNSTLFLDEIAEMPFETQAKLLRVLQEGTFERLGSPQSVKVNVRIIAATNKILHEEVDKNTFRRDLFYRLNIFPLSLPPLRERKDDIPQLVWKFINDLSEQMGKRISRVAKRDMDMLCAYSWPGNIRELRNVIEHALIISKGDALELSMRHLPSEKTRNGTSQTLIEVEREYIKSILALTKGRIKGPGGAAERLGLNPATLYSRMRKLNIAPT